jgi:hypothetical protein
MYKIILALLVSLLQLGCKEEPPVKPPDNGVTPKITLTKEDASCTEVWLSVKVTPLPDLAEINLFKDEMLLFSINTSSLDTLLYEENLSPNQAYIYKVKVIYKEKEYIDSISVTTLDTTSHNFTWQTFAFGDHSNSILRDVVVIDDNNIWAVGEINIADTSGYTTYNAVHWNGSQWELRRITVEFRGNLITPPLEGVFAFSSTDIWFVGSLPIHGDGENWIIYDIRTTVDPNISVSKAWGASSNDIYFIGRNGSIAWKNGNQWSKMQSGTTVDLLDIWGSPDGIIWACGYNSEDAFTALLRYDGIQWNKVYEGSPNNQNNNEYIGPIAGIWTNSKFFTYVTNWAFIYTQPNKNTLDIKRITPWFSDVAFAMRGTNHNNIFIAGQDGLIGHYNGVTYTEFSELKESAKNYLAVAVKENIAVAAGIKYGALSSQAVISIGRR